MVDEMKDYERVKPTRDARGELVIDSRLADEESGYGIDPTTNELFAWADDGMIVLSLDPEVMLRLAMQALPDDHPLKITDQDIALLASRVRTMEPIKNHPGWIQEAAMWSALHAKLSALLPPQ